MTTYPVKVELPYGRFCNIVRSVYDPRPTSVVVNDGGSEYFKLYEWCGTIKFEGRNDVDVLGWSTSRDTPPYLWEAPWVKD